MDSGDDAHVKQAMFAVGIDVPVTEDRVSEVVEFHRHFALAVKSTMVDLAVNSPQATWSVQYPWNAGESSTVPSVPTTVRWVSSCTC